MPSKSDGGMKVRCPKCSAENPPDNKFCGGRGEPLSSVSQMPTMEAPEQESPQAPVPSPHVGRIISSDSVPAGGFAPGAILADRYRIIGLLGRGGMGEVYRADDLKLGQPVVLVQLQFHLGTSRYGSPPGNLNIPSRFSPFLRPKKCYTV